MEAVGIDAARTPSAQLAPVTPLASQPRRVLGSLAGRMHIPDNFDAPLSDDVLDLFEASGTTLEGAVR